MSRRSAYFKSGKGDDTFVRDNYKSNIRSSINNIEDIDDTVRRDMERYAEQLSRYL